MVCKKCGNEIKDEDTFCSKCGNNIVDIKNQQYNESNNKKKFNRRNKKIIYAIIGTIIVIIIAVVGIVLGTNKNEDTIDNENISIEKTSNSQSEIKDFKYVQEDSKSFCGKSFKNVDFEIFKENIVKLWFAEQSEYDLVKEMNRTLYGEDYGKWLSFIDNKGDNFEEIKTIYTKSGNMNGPWIPNKMIDIYYNEDKTSVYGIAIYISDYYLGRIGRSKLVENIDEVINCLPSDFKEEVNKRIDSKKTMGYEDFNIGYNENVTLQNNEEYYIVTILCAESTDKQETQENLNTNINTQSTDSNINDNIVNSNNNATTNSPSFNSNNSSTQTSTPSNSSNGTENNNNNSNNTPTKEEVSIADLNTETLSYNEFVTKVKQRGLNIVEKQTNDEIPYYQTTKDKYYEVDTSRTYYKGDTVTIYLSKIVPVTKHFNSDFILCGYSVILSQSTFLDESKTKQGVKLYFNNKLVMSGDGEFDYKFTNEKQITIKAVAPYILIDGEWKKNYTVLETTDSVEKLMYYADSRMGIASAYRALLKV